MRIFFAGAETYLGKGYMFNYEPDSDLFLSYFYANSTRHALRKLHETGHRGLRVIDSGAFTFFASHNFVSSGIQRKRGKRDVPPIREYFVDYLAWLREHYNLFDYFIELDLQEIYGKEMVEGFRQAIRDAGLESKAIYVFHSGDSWEELGRMIATSKSKYLGIQGFRLGEDPIDYMRACRMCYEGGVRLHGFAFTKSQILHQVPLFSVDSTTYAGVERYGVLAKFDGHNLRIIHGQTATAEELQKIGVPLFVHPQLKGRRIMSLRLKHAELEYRKLQKFLTELWVSRGIVWE